MTRHQQLKERLTRLSGTKGEGVQAAIHRLLGSSKATVSDWFTGKRSPSAGAFLKMALKAKDPTDKTWFLEEAGLVGGELRDVLELLQSKDEPSASIGALNDPSAPTISLPRFLIPSPEKSAYFRLTRECNDPPFWEGQTVVVDFSKKQGKKVAPYWDQIVLVRIDPYSERGGHFLSEGYRVGELVYEPVMDRDFVGGLPLLCQVNRYRDGLRLREQRWGSAEPVRNRSEVERSHAEAKREMETEEYVSIEGRVIACFWPNRMPGLEDSDGENLTVQPAKAKGAVHKRRKRPQGG